jgi:hypothetical protein
VSSVHTAPDGVAIQPWREVRCPVWALIQMLRLLAPGGCCASSQATQSRQSPELVMRGPTSAPVRPHGLLWDPGRLLIFLCWWSQVAAPLQRP